MFGGRDPQTITYDKVNQNRNNIKTAKLAKWVYFLRSVDESDKDELDKMEDFEKAI